jgi:hypothetical protein
LAAGNGSDDLADPFTIPHGITCYVDGPGSVNLSTEVAREGTIIGLTTKPDENCQLVYLVAFDLQGVQIQIDSYKEKNYIFTMPDRDVKITAVFRSIDDNSTYRLSATPVGREIEGMFFSVDDLDHINAGESVTITCLPHDPNAFDDPLTNNALGVVVTAKDKFGNYVALPGANRQSHGLSLMEHINSSYSFDMPPLDLYLDIQLGLHPYKISLTKVGGQGDLIYSVQSSDITGPWGGETVTVSVSQPAAILNDPSIPMEYVESITVKDAAGNDVPVVGSDTFFMPSSDVYVTAVINSSLLKYDITVNAIGEGSLDLHASFGTDKGINCAAPQSRVYLDGQTDELHELAYVSVQDANGNLIPISKNNDSFIMPDCDVTVTAIFREKGDNQYYNITLIASAGTTSAEVNGVETLQARAGETVSIVPQSLYNPPGYFDEMNIKPLFADIRVEGDSGVGVYLLSRYQWYKDALRTYHDQFVMPPMDVVVYAEILTDEPLSISVEAVGGNLLCDTNVYNRPGPYVGDVVKISWLPDMNFEDPNDRLDNYYLESVVVKDALGFEVPVSNLKFVMPETNVTVYGVIKNKVDNNFGATYRVTLDPGLAGGEPVVYESSSGMPTINAKDFEFYLDTPGNWPSFRLHKYALPDSISGPFGYDFIGWEEVTDENGYNRLNSRDTTFTAKWQRIDLLEDSRFSYSFGPVRYIGDSECLFDITVDDLAFNWSWYNDLPFTPKSADIIIPTNYVCLYRDNTRAYTMSRVEKQTKNFYIQGQSRHVLVSLPGYEELRPGTYTGQLSVLSGFSNGEQTEYKLSEETITLVKTGYELSTEAYTIAGARDSYIPCTLTGLGLGMLPSEDGSDNYVQTSGIRFEWYPTTLTGPDGEEIRVYVNEDTSQTSQTTGVFTLKDDSFEMPIWINPDEYDAARMGTYKGELHYSTSYTLEGSETEIRGEDGVIHLSLTIGDQGRNYNDLESDGTVRFFIEDEDGQCQVTKAFVGDMVFARLNKDAIASGYGYGGFFETQDVNLEYIEEGYYVFQMPDQPVRITAHQEPIVLATPSYTINFVKEDGTLLQSVSAEEGTTPSYTGDDLVKKEDEGYTYTFAGWEPEIVPAVDNVVYVAKFTATPKTYSVKFLNADGTELKSSLVSYGQRPETPGIPKKAADAQYTYSFAGWTPAIGSVTGDTTYTATYTTTLRSYPVWFINQNKEVLQVSELPFGEMPTYAGKTPTLESDGQYDYTFSGWSPKIDTVIGYTVYTAQYDAEAVYYAVTVFDGTLSGYYAVGDSVTITADEPVNGKRFKEWIGVDGLTFTEGSATSETATFTMPAEAVTISAVYEDIPVTRYSLNGEYLLFFDEDSNEITEAAEGQTVIVSADSDTFPEGYYFTGEYTSKQVEIVLDERGDGSFTMLAEDVAVIAVLAEQEDYELLLANDTPVELPADMSWMLGANEAWSYDETLETGVLDLNGDGKADVLLDTENNTAKRLAGANAITGSVSLPIEYPVPYRYKTVVITIPEEKIPVDTSAPKLYGATASNGTVTFTWAANSGVDKYAVFRKVDSGSWKKIGVTSEISYVDTTVAEGHTYCYTARGIDETGKYITNYDKKGVTVTIASAETLDKTSPVLKTATAGVNGITVTWTANNGVPKYAVFRKVAGGKWKRIAETTGSGTEGVKATAGSTCSYIDGTAVAGKTYTYTVRGLDESGDYITDFDANGVTATMPEAEVLDETSPVLVGATAGAKGITVTWTANSGVFKYAVFRKVAGGKWARIAETTGSGTEGVKAAAGTTCCYVDGTAEAGTTYTYTVRGLDESGNYVTNFDANGVKAKGVLDKTSPVLGNVTVGDNGITLTWTANSGVPKYAVFRKVAGGKWIRIAETTGSGNEGVKATAGSTCSYVDGTAVAGTTYVYTVRGIDANGTYITNFDTNGVTSAEVLDKTSPVLGSATASANGITVTWTANSGVPKYAVFRKVAGGKWTRIAETTGSGTEGVKAAAGSTCSYIDVMAVAGTTYTYTVRGLDESGKYLTNFNADGVCVKAE